MKIETITANLRLPSLFTTHYPLLTTQLMLSLAAFLLLSSLLTRKPFGFIVLPLSLSIFALLSISLYTTGELVSSVFYSHLDFESLKVALAEFKPQLLLLLLLLAAALCLLLLSSKLWRKAPRGGKIAAALSSLFILFLPAGLFSQTFNLYKERGVKAPQELTALLKDLGITEYTPRESVKTVPLAGAKKRDIVVIVLESFEYEYLFKGDTPNLDNLSKQWSFYPALHSDTRWTIEGIYAMQMGLPAKFARPTNRVFKSALNPKLAGLGDAFKAAGYEMLYIIANPPVGGAEALLSLYGYRVLGNSADYPPYASPKKGFGPHDRFTFSLAKKEFDNLTQGTAPFLMFAHTIDLHGRSGRADGELIESYAGGDPIAGIVRYTDSLTGEFVKYMLQSSREPIIIILPDHPHHMRRRGGRLWVLSSTPLFYKGDKRINYFRLPAAFIRAAGLSSNIRFVEDLLKSKASPASLIAINNSAWEVAPSKLLVKNIKTAYLTNNRLTLSGDNGSVSVTLPKRFSVINGVLAEDEAGDISAYGDKLCAPVRDGCLTLSQGVNYAADFFSSLDKSDNVP